MGGRQKNVLWEAQEETVSRSSCVSCSKRSSNIRSNKSLLEFFAMGTTGDFEYSF